MRIKLLVAIVVCGAACGDGRQGCERTPRAMPTDSSFLADMARRDITVPNDPGVRG